MRLTEPTERNPAGERVAALEVRLTAEVKRLDDLRGESRRQQDAFEATVRDGFIKQNEFRGALADLGKEMATRRELEATTEQLRLLTSRVEANRGIFATLVDLQAFRDLYEKAHRPLADYVASQVGRSRGLGDTAKVAYGVLALVLTLTSLYLYQHRPAQKIVGCPLGYSCVREPAGP